MVTTKDNPWDPFNEFESWFEFDVRNGYYTSQALAELQTTHPEMDEKTAWLMNEISNDALVEKYPEIYVKKFYKE